MRQYCGADVEKVWRNCKLALQAGLWLEITKLVIPGVNNEDEVLRGIAERIGGELGPDVAWHVSGYHPAYRFDAPPTPMTDLERAWRTGQEAGLNFFYLGNASGHRLENTYCPGCEALLMERRGLGLVGFHLDGGCRPNCGRMVPGVWW